MMQQLLDPPCANQLKTAAHVLGRGLALRGNMKLSCGNTAALVMSRARPPPPLTSATQCGQLLQDHQGHAKPRRRSH